MSTLGPTPDEVAKAKLVALHDAQNRYREELVNKEATAFAPPELSRAERRRAQRMKRHLKGLRP